MMMRWLSATLAAALLLGTATSARQQAEQGQRPAQQPKPSPPAETSSQTRPQEPPLGQPLNVKVDLTIMDESGTPQPAKKTITMIVANGGNGYIRAFGNDPSVKINVDARPRIHSNGSIHVQLGLEYNPRTSGNPPSGLVRLGSLNQAIGLYLESGKPMVLSQSADPESDRKVTVEVRATVLK
jgi:hypothetical protein